MDIRHKIQRLEHNFCVTAGAGAGKTTCLKDTYLGLLDQGVTPGQIVAITFTEKAAEEMRSRVVRAVADRAQEDSTRDWRGLLTQVEWAPLSTIHSFCASLLREFGVLLGLDPDFAVVDENEFAALVDELIQDTLRGRLSRGDEGLRRLLAHYPSQIADYIGQAYRSLRTDGLSPAQARKITARTHADESTAGDDLVAEVAGGIGLLEKICSEKKINWDKPYGMKIKGLLDGWSALAEALLKNNSDRRIITQLEELTSGAWYAAKPARDIIRPAVERLQALSYLPLAAQLSDDLLDLVEEVNGLIERECRRRSWLSFDDLLLLSRDLMQDHASVLSELRERWRVLMVDEFQDVNPVQGQLVRLLAGLDEQNPQPPPPRLMVVGDRKQSIYAFRGADVTVFAKTMGEFPELGGEVAALKENFRSQPRLIEFFNRIFHQVFSDAGLIDQAPLVFVDFNADDEQKPGRERSEPASAMVELLEVDNPSDDLEQKLPAAAWRHLEAEAVAAYLNQLINGHGLPAGDIAIIFRRLTQVGVYEDALRRAGVGFYTVRGRGFYDCQEVADLYLAMSAILNPRDNLALAGFLRSPMVGLSDEALLALVYPDGRTFRSLSDSIKDAATLPVWLGDEQLSRWQKALGSFQKLSPMARRMSPAELIECLLDATGIMPVLMAAPLGEQKVANLRKLLETAREPQGALAGGVEGFLRGLGAMVESPPDDPQAPLMGEEAQVVRLLSVHQAKGLEFPVVILPDLDAGRSGGGGLPISRSGVAGMKPRDPLTNKLIQTPVSKGVADFQAAVEESETARLFYVACTRAEERLVFVQTQAQRERGNPKGWVKWVEKFVRDDDETRIVTSADLGRPPEAKGRGIAFDWPGLIPTEPGHKDAEGAAIVKRVLQPGPLTQPENRVVRISVSGLENWFACPRLSLITRLYGLDTAVLPQRGASRSEESSEIDPVALGSAVHKALETADLSAGPAGLEPALAALAPDLAGEVRDLAGGVWDTELAGLMNGLPASHFLKEQPFRLWLEPGPESPGVEVMGELDLVIIRPAPEPPIIVDYKVTKKIDPEHYRNQLGLYALALWSGNPDGPVPRTCLCYLREAGAELVELSFSAKELVRYRDRIIRAGSDMAALPLDVRPSDLPPGRDCAHCVLAGHGLCPESGSEA
jgi:ATP-dependent helicase/nuclease subunit A